MHPRISKERRLSPSAGSLALRPWFRPTFLVLGWLCLACPLSVGAEAEEDLFSRLDSDQDGVIAADEVSEEDRRLFERVLKRGDADQDGKLTANEFDTGTQDDEPTNIPGLLREGIVGDRGGAGGLRLDPDRIFDRLDQDKDNRLTAGERPEDSKGPMRRLLAQLPQEGEITRDQFRQLFQRLQASRPGPNGAAGTGDAPGAPGPFGNGALGRLGLEGFLPGPPGPGPLLAVLDTDANGQLSAEEIAGAAKSLAQLDQNADGKLDHSELSPAGPPPGDAPGRGPRGQGRGDGRGAARLKEADQDGDGKISREEAPERLKERFDQLDTNQDKALDMQELKALRTDDGTKASEAGGKPGRGRRLRRP